MPDINLDKAQAESDLSQLVSWINGYVSRMHRDISDEERGLIADEMCCEWSNSGLGASYQEAAE